MDGVKVDDWTGCYQLTDFSWKIFAGCTIFWGIVFGCWLHFCKNWKMYMFEWSSYWEIAWNEIPGEHLGCANFPENFKVEDADAEMGAGPILLWVRRRFPFVALVMFNMFGCNNPPTKIHHFGCAKIQGMTKITKKKWTMKVEILCRFDM